MSDKIPHKCKIQIDIWFKPCVRPTFCLGSLMLKKKKKHALFRTCLGNQSWRRLRDSNPSWSMTPLSVFKTDPFNHLGKPPFMVLPAGFEPAT